MKVIELLKDERNLHLNIFEQNKELGNPNDDNYIALLNEAIKELENLQNRKCENCKHNKKQDNFMIFCDKVMCQDGSKMMWHSFTKDFSCKYWELK